MNQGSVAHSEYDVFSPDVRADHYPGHTLEVVFDPKSGKLYRETIAPQPTPVCPDAEDEFWSAIHGARINIHNEAIVMIRLAMEDTPEEASSLFRASILQKRGAFSTGITTSPSFLRGLICTPPNPAKNKPFWRARRPFYLDNLGATIFNDQKLRRFIDRYVNPHFNDLSNYRDH